LSGGGAATARVPSAVSTLNVVAPEFIQRLTCRMYLDRACLFVRDIRALNFDHFPRVRNVRRNRGGERSQGAVGRGNLNVCVFQLACEPVPFNCGAGG
jgi:hypothetical protein